MSDLDQLVSDLQNAEGWRGYLYDDATGERIVPGYTVKGHPTIGWGFALDVNPFTQEELLPILQGRAKATDAANNKTFSWFAALPEVAQRAMSNMSYNLGQNGLQKFTTFLALMRGHSFQAAADDLTQTAWAKQVGTRAVYIEGLIRGAV